MKESWLFRRLSHSFFNEYHTYIYTSYILSGSKWLHTRNTIVTHIHCIITPVNSKKIDMLSAMLIAGIFSLLQPVVIYRNIQNLHLIISKAHGISHVQNKQITETIYGIN